ncbi:F-box/kelch-repeat protein At3g23880-like [Vicia villosa]|uniref:F-box/kelch-repeat protein At3g23880-like n=1 Tax=Vicia villosa TaxID=3911 RepID=UPI00273C1EDC|nr:F-box/kelch-repeat protein At3g23880-like [Vicia villosa]
MELNFLHTFVITFVQSYKSCVALIYSGAKFFSPDGDVLWCHLPEELILEILLRLPVRSLHQFKCICKSWNTLISNPQFIKRHLQISKAKPSLTNQRLFFSFFNEPHKLFYYPLKPLFENQSPPVSFSHVKEPEYNVIGSCNGLLCLHDRFQNSVRLWNPSIMLKSKKSPRALNLVSKHSGFGYDQVNDKYKVLFVMQNLNDPSHIFTKIYTFGDDSWKTIQNFHHTPIRPLRLPGKFVSGTLNWIVKKRDVSSNQSAILSFDLENETYKEMVLPRDDGDDEVHGHLLYVLNNCLGVCHVSNKTSWVAWMMKEYGVVESWTKLMSISYDMFNKQPYLPMYISENDVVLLMNKHTTQLVLYNLNSGQLINSLYDTLESNDTFRINPHICCESLVSVP